MRRSQLILLIVCILVPSLFFWQNVMELRAEEPRRAIVSLEMLLTGEWIVPHINGWSYYNKPPLFNWIMAASFWLFGSYDEWVVRFPSLLSACIHALLIYYISKRFIQKEAAIYAAFMYLCCAEILFYGTITSGEIDLFFSLITFLQVTAIFHYSEKNSWWKLFLVSYFFTTLGLLTKGLPSLAFQALTLLVWMSYQRKFLRLLSIQHVAGIALLGILSGLYFYAYHLQDDLIGFLVRQYKEAAMRTGLETESTSTGAFLFIPNFLKLFAPWSILIVLFFKRSKLLFQSSRYVQFWALFFLVNIPIYWISGEFKARYYYIFLSAISILTAVAYVENIEFMPKFKRVLSIFVRVFAVVVPMACLIAFFVQVPLPVDMLRGRIAAVLLVSIVVAWFVFKANDIPLQFVLLLCLVRVGLNLFYLPAWQNDPGIVHHRDTMNIVLQVSGGEAVYLFGDVYSFRSDASFGPLKFGEVELKTAPLLSYRIPYYMSRSTGKVMEFDTVMRRNTFYLADARIVDTINNPVLFRLYDNWQQNHYVLLKSE